MQMPLFIVDAELLKESTLLSLANTLKIKKNIKQSSALHLTFRQRVQRLKFAAPSKPMSPNSNPYHVKLECYVSSNLLLDSLVGQGAYLLTR